MFYEGKREEWITLIGRDGKRITDKSDARKAEAALSEAEEQRQRGVLAKRAHRAGLTLGEAIDEYLLVRASSMARSTRVTYRAALGTARKVLGRMPVSSIVSADVELLQGTLLARGLQPQTAVNYLTILSACLAWHVEKGTIQQNPVSKAKRVRVPEKERALLTWEQADAILQHVDHPPYKAAIGLALYAGLRKGEVLSLRWQAVSMEERIIHVRNAGAFVTKSGKERITVMPPQLKELLEQCPHTSSYVVSRRRFPNLDRPLGRWALDRVWFAARDAAGLPQLRFHDLRGSFATELLQNFAPAVVQQVMGHENIETTMNYYNRLTSASAADIIMSKMFP